MTATNSFNDNAYSLEADYDDDDIIYNYATGIRKQNHKLVIKNKTRYSNMFFFVSKNKS